MKSSVFSKWVVITLALFSFTSWGWADQASNLESLIASEELELDDSTTQEETSAVPALNQEETSKAPAPAQKEEKEIKYSIWPYSKKGVRPDETGTLLVTYTTGPKQERMDRIRFLLTDPQGNSAMFPQKDLFNVETVSGSYQISIVNLPPGQYSLQFLIPNADNLFAQVPIREFIVRESEVLRIHQKLEPQFGVIEASVDPESFDRALEELPFDLSISVLDAETKRVVRESLTGHLLADNLPPGEYLVVFGDAPDYTPPEPVRINLKPKAYEGDFIKKYQRKTTELAILSNREDLHWSLFRSGKEVISKQGNFRDVNFPTGQHFSIEPEEIPGYIAQVSPAENFDLKFGESTRISIIYTPEYGYLSLEAPALHEGEVLNLTLKSMSGGPILNIPIRQEGDTLIWKSGGLLTGKYLVEFNLPPNYEPLSPQEITVVKDQMALLSPAFTEKKNLYIRTGHPHAIFTATHLESGKKYEGNGYSHTFRSLTPGTYHVQFSTTTDSLYVAPKDQTITIEPDQDYTLEVVYRQAGKLIVSSNVVDYSVQIRSLDRDDEVYNINIPRSSKSISLPQGAYVMSFNPIAGKRAFRYGDNYPDPVRFRVEADQTERIHGIFEPQKGSLVVTSNIEEAMFTVYDTSEGEKMIVGRFSGKHSVIPLTFVGHYLVEFEKVANYQLPDPISVEVQAEERQVVGGVYLPLHELVTIARGPAIVGDVFGEGGEDERPARTVDLDAFSISAKEVTNQQYAMWLTKALREGKIVYSLGQGIVGQVKDLQGHLLFETLDGDPDSQIRVFEDEGGLVFRALAGKENHPVVEVSWYGANLYCQDNGYLLPTEAQWEKAAGMAVTRPNEPLKKFRYGNGKDHVNTQLANYLDRFDAADPSMMATRPVGFYDGINMLELSPTIVTDIKGDPMLAEKEYGTLNAKSPHGLFDASGNVREWTSDWYSPDYLKNMTAVNPKGPGHGTKKVTKGGAYNSFVYELRVAARQPLFPESTDAYTGFRVVLDKTAKLKKEES